MNNKSCHRRRGGLLIVRAPPALKLWLKPFFRYIHFRGRFLASFWKKASPNNVHI